MFWPMWVRPPPHSFSRGWTALSTTTTRPAQAGVEARQVQGGGDAGGAGADDENVYVYLFGHS
jgi:hypothetical protein